MTKSKKAAKPFVIEGLKVVTAAVGVDDLIAVIPNRAKLWDKSNDARIGLRLSKDQIAEIETHSIGSLNATISCLLVYAVQDLRKKKKQLQISRAG